MKERLLLLLIITGLGCFLCVFQNYFDTLWGLVFLCVLMVLYAIFLQLATIHKRRVLRKKPIVVNENYKPFVSVMIPAHNEGYVIKETVETVLAMDYENFEVIVIDDRSTDSTPDAIRELEEKYENVKALYRKEGAFPGKSAVLNDALKLAKGDAILVFDADARMDKDFLKKLIPHLEPEDVGAVQARKIDSNKDVNL